MLRRVLVSLLAFTVIAAAGCSGAHRAAAPVRTSGATEHAAPAEDGGGEADGGEGDADAAAAPARIEAAASVRKAPARINTAGAPAAGWQSEQVWSASSNDWEPSIAADPSSNWVYQATTRYGGPKACTGCPDPAIIVRASSDGGVTWGADRYICACKNVKAQNDPVLAVSTAGVIYAVWMNDYNPGVVFAKSSDHGATWTAPISLKGKGLSFTDKPWLAISPNGQDVYVAFNSSDSYVVASHNAGASFAARVKTNSDSLYWFAEGGAVAPGGTVYFAESAENQSATGPVKLAVLKSTNGGTSWTTTFVDTSQQQPACTVPSCGADFFAPSASLDVDGSGKILLAYSANGAAAANKSMYVRTSTDGITWSARTDIGQNTGDNGFPSVEAGATAGDFRVVWQDSRNGASAWNTWYRRTTDGGATWAAQVKLSDATSGAPYKTASGYAFPYGDYLDIAVNASGTNLVTWGEGPNYVGPGGTWFTRGA
jgi:hypothetical protein